MFYQKWMEEQAQKLVDATARAFTQGRMGSSQGATPRMPMVLFFGFFDKECFRTLFLSRVSGITCVC